LGNTDEVLTFGEYKIYVYDYDIASTLGNPQSYGIEGT
jgi:hypothetical protein